MALSKTGNFGLNEAFNFLYNTFKSFSPNIKRFLYKYLGFIALKPSTRYHGTFYTFYTSKNVFNSVLSSIKVYFSLGRFNRGWLKYAELNSHKDIADIWK